MSLASRLLSLSILAVSVAACAGLDLPPAAGPATPAAASDAPSVERLDAGTYHTQAFRPTLTFTVPAGWELVADTPSWIHLRPQGAENQGLYVFRDAVAASQDPTCPTTPAAGVGTTSSELLTFLRALPGAVSGTPALVSVGGLRGSSLDLGIADGWSQSCPFAGGVPTVPLIMNAGIDRWVLAGSERLRLYLLDLAGGGNVVVDVDDFDGGGIDGLLAAAGPVIKSFQFGDDATTSPGPSAPPSTGASSPDSVASPSASATSGP